MSDTKTYYTITDANFEREVIESSTPVLVDFWAAWCGPCRMIAPAIEELADEFQGRVKVAKVDVDANPAIASRFGIRSIPTLLFFQGGQVVDQVVGVLPKRTLAEKLNGLVEAAA
jgi:thioredoxin 1